METWKVILHHAKVGLTKDSSQGHILGPIFPNINAIFYNSDTCMSKVISLSKGENHLFNIGIVCPMMSVFVLFASDSVYLFVLPYHT